MKMNSVVAKRFWRRTLIGSTIALLLLLLVLPALPVAADDGQTPTPRVIQVTEPDMPNPLRLPATGYAPVEPPPSVLTLILAGVGALCFVAGGMSWVVGRRR